MVEWASSYLAHTLLILSIIPHNQQEDILLKTTSLIRNKMETFGIVQILEVVSALPQDQRDSIVTKAHSLIREDMRYYEISQILKTLSTAKI